MNPIAGVKIVFFGTSDFALPALTGLANAGVELLVITQPDKPSGRRQEVRTTPVKAAAASLHLPVIQPAFLKTNSDFITQLKDFKPEVGVVVSYAQIIPKFILEIPDKGVLNIHPSALPTYRGPSPIQAALRNGDTQTAVTVMQIDEKMDHGPILSQISIPIAPSDTNQTLHDRLGEIGATELVRVLPLFLSGTLKPTPQDHTQATYTKILNREDGLIDWSASASQIDCQFRALQPWPGVYTIWQGKRLKIAKLSVLEGQNEARPTGSVFYSANDLPAVQTGQGSIALKAVQLEGKNETRGTDFARGYKGFVGSTL